MHLLGSLGLAVVVVACASTPGAVVSPSSGAAPTQSPSAPPSVEASDAPTPSPSVAPSASPVPGMLESTTEPATEAPAGSIRLEMFGPPPQFRPTSLTAAPGEVVFYLENGSPSGQEHGTHTLAIGTTQGAPIVVSDEVRGGRRAVFTVHGLEAGDYVIWCTLFGHAGLGQEGTLKVG